MPELIASIFPHAVAVALSPMPIAALIFLLLSNRAKANSLAFLFGWFLAIFANVGIIMVLFNHLPDATSTKAPLAAIIQGALGTLLVFLALKQWHLRPRPGQPPRTPKWLNAVESFTPWKAFLLAISLVTINAKNTVIDIAAGVIIAEQSTSYGESLITLLFFAGIASITIAFPVLAFLLLGNQLEGSLNRLKTWFIYNSPTILFVLFLILGVELISKAFGG